MHLQFFRQELLNLPQVAASTQQGAASPQQNAAPPQQVAAASPQQGASPQDKPVTGGRSSDVWVAQIQSDFLFVSLSGGYSLLLLITYWKLVGIFFSYKMPAIFHWLSKPVADTDQLLWFSWPEGRTMTQVLVCWETEKAAVCMAGRVCWVGNCLCHGVVAYIWYVPKWDVLKCSNWHTGYSKSYYCRIWLAELLALHFHIAVQGHSVPTTFALRSSSQQMLALTCLVFIVFLSKENKNDHVKTKLQEQTSVTMAMMNSFPHKLGEKFSWGKKYQVWMSCAFAWALGGKLLSWPGFSPLLYSTVSWASEWFVNCPIKPTVESLCAQTNCFQPQKANWQP